MALGISSAFLRCWVSMKNEGNKIEWKILQQLRSANETKHFYYFTNQLNTKNMKIINSGTYPHGNY